MSTNDLYLNQEEYDTVVEMINWCLMDIEGGDYESDQEGKQAQEFENRIRHLAENKMGLKNLKEKKYGL